VSSLTIVGCNNERASIGETDSGARLPFFDYFFTHHEQLPWAIARAEATAAQRLSLTRF
jgi:hypothetical protein